MSMTVLLMMNTKQRQKNYDMVGHEKIIIIKNTKIVLRWIVFSNLASVAWSTSETPAKDPLGRRFRADVFETRYNMERMSLHILESL